MGKSFIISTAFKSSLLYINKSLIFSVNHKKKFKNKRDGRWFLIKHFTDFMIVGHYVTSTKFIKIKVILYILDG